MIKWLNDLWYIHIVDTAITNVAENLYSFVSIVINSILRKSKYQSITQSM